MKYYIALLTDLDIYCLVENLFLEVYISTNNSYRKLFSLEMSL